MWKNLRFIPFHFAFYFIGLLFLLFKISNWDIIILFPRPWFLLPIWIDLKLSYLGRRLKTFLNDIVSYHLKSYWVYMEELNRLWLQHKLNNYKKGLNCVQCIIWSGCIILWEHSCSIIFRWPRKWLLSRVHGWADFCQDVQNSQVPLSNKVLEQNSLSLVPLY